MKRNLRILMTTPFYPPPVHGGVPQYVQCMVHSLKKLGHDVVVLCIPLCENTLKKYHLEIDNGIKVYRFDESKNSIKKELHSHSLRWGKMISDTIPLVNKIVEQEAPFDVVHINDYFGSMYMEYFKLYQKIPVVSTMHALGSVQSALADSLRRYTVANSDITICVSNSLRSDIYERYGSEIAGGNMVTVYNGVNMRKSPQMVEKENIITFAGRLTKLKGADILLNALHCLKQEGVLVTAHIMGDGPERKNLEEQSRRLSIQDQVVFHGFLTPNEVRTILFRAKIHVVCSSAEPFGLTALEGMAEGACVIAPEIGGLKEFIHDGINGVLYPYGEIEILTLKLKELINNEEMRLKLSQKAKETAQAMSWDVSAGQTAEQYFSAIEDFNVDNVSILGRGI